MRMKRRCSVMPAHGPTAPPQMSKLGLREGAEQSRRREGVTGWGTQSSADLREGLVGGEGRVGFGKGRKN